MVWDATSLCLKNILIDFWFFIEKNIRTGLDLNEDHGKFLQNIRSLGANFDEFISYLQSTDTNCNLIAFTETWLREFSNLQIFTQSPYKTILSEHKKSGRGGGVALLAKDKNCLSRVLSESKKTSKN